MIRQKSVLDSLWNKYFIEKLDEKYYKGVFLEIYNYLHLFPQSFFEIQDLSHLPPIFKAQIDLISFLSMKRDIICAIDESDIAFYPVIRTVVQYAMNIAFFCKNLDFEQYIFNEDSIKFFRVLLLLLCHFEEDVLIVLMFLLNEIPIDSELYISNQQYHKFMFLILQEIVQYIVIEQYPTEVSYGFLTRYLLLVFNNITQIDIEEKEILQITSILNWVSQISDSSILRNHFVSIIVPLFSSFTSIFNCQRIPSLVLFSFGVSIIKSLTRIIEKTSPPDPECVSQYIVFLQFLYWVFDEFPIKGLNDSVISHIFIEYNHDEMVFLNRDRDYVLVDDFDEIEQLYPDEKAKFLISSQLMNAIVVINEYFASLPTINHLNAFFSHSLKMIMNRNFVKSGLSEPRYETIGLYFIISISFMFSNSYNNSDIISIPWNCFFSKYIFSTFQNQSEFDFSIKRYSRISAFIYLKRVFYLNTSLSSVILTNVEKILDISDEYSYHDVILFLNDLYETDKEYLSRVLIINDFLPKFNQYGLLLSKNRDLVNYRNTFISAMYKILMDPLFYPVVFQTENAQPFFEIGLFDYNLRELFMKKMKHIMRDYNSYSILRILSFFFSKAINHSCNEEWMILISELCNFLIGEIGSIENFKDEITKLKIFEDSITILYSITDPVGYLVIDSLLRMIVFFLLAIKPKCFDIIYSRPIPILIHGKVSSHLLGSLLHLVFGKDTIISNDTDDVFINNPNGLRTLHTSTMMTSYHAGVFGFIIEISKRHKANLVSICKSDFIEDVITFVFDQTKCISLSYPLFVSLLEMIINWDMSSKLTKYLLTKCPPHMLSWLISVLHRIGKSQKDVLFGSSIFLRGKFTGVTRTNICPQSLSKGFSISYLFSVSFFKKNIKEYVIQINEGIQCIFSSYYFNQVLNIEFNTPNSLFKVELKCPMLTTNSLVHFLFTYSFGEMRIIINGNSVFDERVLLSAPFTDPLHISFGNSMNENQSLGDNGIIGVFFSAILFSPSLTSAQGLRISLLEPSLMNRLDFSKTDIPSAHLQIIESSVLFNISPINHINHSNIFGEVCQFRNSINESLFKTDIVFKLLEASGFCTSVLNMILKMVTSCITKNPSFETSFFSMYSITTFSHAISLSNNLSDNITELLCTFIDMFQNLEKDEHKVTLTNCLLLNYYVWFDKEKVVLKELYLRSLVHFVNDNSSFLEEKIDYSFVFHGLSFCIDNEMVEIYFSFVMFLLNNFYSNERLDVFVNEIQSTRIEISQKSLYMLFGISSLSFSTIQLTNKMSDKSILKLLATLLYGTSKMVDISLFCDEKWKNLYNVFLSGNSHPSYFIVLSLFPQFTNEIEYDAFLLGVLTLLQKDSQFLNFLMSSKATLYGIAYSFYQSKSSNIPNQIFMTLLDIIGKRFELEEILYLLNRFSLISSKIDRKLDSFLVTTFSVLFEDAIKDHCLTRYIRIFNAFFNCIMYKTMKSDPVNRIDILNLIVENSVKLDVQFNHIPIQSDILISFCQKVLIDFNLFDQVFYKKPGFIKRIVFLFVSLIRSKTSNLLWILPVFIRFFKSDPIEYELFIVFLNCFYCQTESNMGFESLFTSFINDFSSYLKVSNFSFDEMNLKPLSKSPEFTNWIKDIVSQIALAKELSLTSHFVRKEKKIFAYINNMSQETLSSHQIRSQNCYLDGNQKILCYLYLQNSPYEVNTKYNFPIGIASKRKIAYLFDCYGVRIQTNRTFITMCYEISLFTCHKCLLQITDHYILVGNELYDLGDIRYIISISINRIHFVFRNGRTYLFEFPFSDSNNIIKNLSRQGRDYSISMDSILNRCKSGLITIYQLIILFNFYKTRSYHDLENYMVFPLFDNNQKIILTSENMSPNDILHFLSTQEILAIQTNAIPEIYSIPNNNMYHYRNLLESSPISDVLNWIRINFDLTIPETSFVIPKRIITNIKSASFSCLSTTSCPILFVTIENNKIYSLSQSGFFVVSEFIETSSNSQITLKSINRTKLNNFSTNQIDLLPSSLITSHNIFMFSINESPMICGIKFNHLSSDNFTSIPIFPSPTFVQKIGNNQIIVLNRTNIIHRLIYSSGKFVIKKLAHHKDKIIAGSYNETSSFLSTLDEGGDLYIYNTPSMEIHEHRVVPKDISMYALLSNNNIAAVSCCKTHSSIQIISPFNHIQTQYESQIHSISLIFIEPFTEMIAISFFKSILLLDSTTLCPVRKINTVGLSKWVYFNNHNQTLLYMDGDRSIMLSKLSK